MKQNGEDVHAAVSVLPDLVLAERVRDGDEHAFEALFRRYYDALRRFAFSYTYSIDAAEDVVQETLVAVWIRHAEFARHSSPAAYLYAAVRNRALKGEARAAVRQRYARTMTASSPPVVPGADEVMLASEFARAVYEQVEALPPRVREVYRLRHDEGLSSAEVASVLGITTPSVYVQMARAIKLLSARLESWFA